MLSNLGFCVTVSPGPKINDGCATMHAQVVSISIIAGALPVLEIVIENSSLSPCVTFPKSTVSGVTETFGTAGTNYVRSLIDVSIVSRTSSI